jgi:hypothetical protein
MSSLTQSQRPSNKEDILRKASNIRSNKEDILRKASSIRLSRDIIRLSNREVIPLPNRGIPFSKGIRTSSSIRSRTRDILRNSRATARLLRASSSSPASRARR